MDVESSDEHDVARWWRVVAACVAGGCLLAAVFLGWRLFGPPRRATVLLDGRMLRVDVADTTARRQRGLQGYRSLADGSGMLFVQDAPEPVTIMMKSVVFPIDIAFVDDTGRVVKTAQLDPGSSRSVASSMPALYVLETPRGWMASNGVGVGSEMGFVGTAP